MGTYYWFADYTNKRYIDGYSAKVAEWRGNPFDQAMITNYLLNQIGQKAVVKFAADESGEWDELHELKFKDYTCENIYNMYDCGYFDEFTKPIWLGNLSWILKKFQTMKDMDTYLKMAKTIPEFMEYYKKAICETLEEPVIYNG